MSYVVAKCFQEKIVITSKKEGVILMKTKAVVCNSGFGGSNPTVGGDTPITHG